MSRYIDASVLLRALAEMWYDSPISVTGISVSELIDKQPSIDIVRCKECKYFIDNLTEDDTDEVYGECCFDWDIKMPKADDFCSYGERKESE